jgi:hypothetical protein
MPQSIVTPEESRDAFDARLAGATLREIAERLGFSVEGARKLLEREAERQVALLHDELLMAGRLELAIPAGGDQLEPALAHARWVVGQLRQRGLAVRVYVRAGLGVIALGLEHDLQEEGR